MKALDYIFSLPSMVVPSLLLGIILFGVFAFAMWAGDGTRTFQTYILSNGEQVSCAHEQSTIAGFNLMGCTDGQTYLAQTNVTRTNGYEQCNGRIVGVYISACLTEKGNK